MPDEETQSRYAQDVVDLKAIIDTLKVLIEEGPDAVMPPLIEEEEEDLVKIVELAVDMADKFSWLVVDEEWYLLGIQREP